jgi:hypothetical protein
MAKKKRRIAVMTFCRNQISTTAAQAASARPSQEEKKAPRRVRVGGSIAHPLAEAGALANAGE